MSSNCGKTKPVLLVIGSGFSGKEIIGSGGQYHRNMQTVLKTPSQSGKTIPESRWFFYAFKFWSRGAENKPVFRSNNPAVFVQF